MGSLRSVRGHAERGGTGVEAGGTVGGCGSRVDGRAKHAVCRRAGRRVTSREAGGTVDNLVGRREGRAELWMVVGSVGSVAIRAERGGMVIRALGVYGADVAAGADVRRRAGRAAVEGDEVVGRAAVGIVGPVRDGAECEGTGVGVLRGDGTDVSAGADVRRRERRGAVEDDEAIDRAVILSAIVR